MPPSSSLLFTGTTFDELVDQAVTAHASTNLLYFMADIEKSIGPDRLATEIHPTGCHWSTKRSQIILTTLQRIYVDQVKDFCSNYHDFGVMTRTAIDSDPSFGEELVGVDPNGNQLDELRLLLREITERRNAGGGVAINDAGDTITDFHIQTLILRDINYRGSVQEAIGHRLKPTKVHQQFIDRLSDTNALEIAAVYWTIKNELMRMHQLDFRQHGIYPSALWAVLGKAQLLFADACVNHGSFTKKVIDNSHPLYCRDDNLNQELYRLTLTPLDLRHPRRIFVVGVYATKCAEFVLQAESLIIEKYSLGSRHNVGTSNGVAERRCSKVHTDKHSKRKYTYAVVPMSQFMISTNPNRVLAQMKSLLTMDEWLGHENLCGVDAIQALCTIATYLKRTCAQCGVRVVPSADID